MCGQIAMSRSLTGPRSMWPPSPGTGIHVPRAWTSAPAPSPVPGPTTTRAPVRPHRCRRRSGRGRPAPRPGSDSDCASKSLRRIISARPKRATESVGSTTQSQLVSGTRSPAIGPASARIADFGVERRLVEHRRLDRVVDGRRSRRCAPSAGARCRRARRRSARSARWCRRCRRSAPGRGCGRGGARS